jgi:hypothetical protein
MADAYLPEAIEAKKRLQCYSFQHCKMCENDPKKCIEFQICKIWGEKLSAESAERENLKNQLRAEGCSEQQLENIIEQLKGIGL